VTTQPAHGTLRFGIGYDSVIGGRCAGNIWAFNYAYYTWTDTTGSALEDFFSIRWRSADGRYTYAYDLLAQSATAEGKNLGLNCPGCYGGNPINAGTGNKFQVETDFVGGAATGLVLRRYYNSQDQTVSEFGASWHSAWHRTMAVSANKVWVTREDGRQDTFSGNNNASNVWTADPDVTAVLTPVSAAGAQTGWKLVRDDDSVELYTLDGLLSSVATREGRVTTLAYNANYQLASVTGPFGHQLTFAYDAIGRVRQMTTPDGLSYTYGYDSLNNLTSVTYPDQTVRRYVYENTSLPYALTGIVDEKGNRFATYGYDTLGRATTTQHAGGAELTTVAYNADGSSSVTDSRGNTHTYALQTQFSMVKPAAVTGAPVPNAGAQAYTYDANGFVSSRTDFNGNVTAYTRDARGLELSRIKAQDTPQARTISTTWHPTFHLPTRITEPSGVAGVNRVTTFSYDPVQGTLLQKTVAAGSLSRTWVYTYTAAGQPKTVTDPNGNITTLAYDTQGGLASVTNALGQTTTYANDADGRLVTSTDPNGLVTTITYTARGQVASQTVGQEVTSYAHDLAGNLTKVTLPDGSFLAYTYNAAHQIKALADALGNHTD
jgi:YD repeat-containing protein